MKRVSCFLGFALSATAATTPAGLVDPVFQFRVGFDSNPMACGGATVATFGGDDAGTVSAALSAAYVPSTPSGSTVRFGYAGETVRFDGWGSENFTTHRVSVAGQRTAGDTSFSVDGAALYVDGNRQTPLADGAANANATALWRERREQLQHRLKVQLQTGLGAYFLRASAALLDYDYRTVVAAGRVAFADRRDLGGGLDCGWKPNARGAWYAGLRAGRQTQDTVPLPGGTFEYSNRYQRVILGWEGKPAQNTTLSFAAGPDFRKYTGNIDPRVFSGTERATLWCEGSFATKLTPALALTAKTSRLYWLSSTGKSAYLDLCAETGLNWTLAGGSSLRCSVKAQRSDYFPTVRDDWQAFFNLGATWKLSGRTSLLVDGQLHRGWNELGTCVDRRFSRVVGSFGTAIKL